MKLNYEILLRYILFIISSSIYLFITKMMLVQLTQLLWSVA